MRVLQTRAMRSSHRPHTRNEQVSGSNPLVGSLFSNDLQGKHASAKRLWPKAGANLLQPVTVTSLGRMETW
jgi:hypothetical protein